MSERFSEQPRSVSQERTLDEVVSDLGEFGSVDSKEWDEGVFGEASEVLSKEFQEANEKKKVDILMKRYADALRRPHRESRFWNTAAMRVPQLDVFRVPGLQFGNNLKRVDPSSGLHVMENPPKIYQYGPSRIYDVRPGEWIDVKNVRVQDVIASSLFTACSALIARHEARVFFAHIRMSDTRTIQELSKQLQSEFPPEAKRALFFPTWIRKNGNEEEDLRKRIEGSITDYPNMIRGTFPYITDDTYNPYDINSTSILVGRTFMRTLGVKEKLGRMAELEGVEVIPEAIKDYT